MRHPIATLLVLACPLAAIGCAGGNAQKVDIGDGHEKPAAVLGESLTDYAGVWDGYAEAFTWNDGTDNVRITLDDHGVGKLEIGQAAPLPAPDPAHGYPPSVDAIDPTGKITLGNLPLLISGFGYPLKDAKVETKRIRFSLSSHELYRAWCEMQPSYLDTGAWPERYACTTGLGWSGNPPMCTAYNGADSTDATMAKPVDCGQAATCITDCTCTKDSCGIDDTADTQLDAALTDNGDALEGTLVVGSDRIVVRMTRMQ